jgi:hypothetical protein
MTKLYVIGDSFSAEESWPTGVKTIHPYPDYDFGASVYWPKKLADRLEADLVNLSIIGCGQDYQWAEIYKHQDEITPDDYVIVVLTEARRFWYFYEYPGLGRADLIAQSPKQRGAAEVAADFERYIQRDMLAVLNLENRLGALSYMAYLRGWRKPLIVYAMSQIADIVRQFKHLEFSKGTLTDISVNEVQIGATEEYYNNKIIRGIDPRYNHLTMSNHRILTDKIFNHFTKQMPLDLTTDFLENVVTEESLKDPDFQDEVSPGAMFWRQSLLKDWRIWRNLGVSLDR